MIQELVGAGLDLVFLLWFWFPGILVSAALGFRRVRDLVPLGFVISTAIASLAYLISYTSNASEFSNVVTRAALVAVAVVSLLRLGRMVYVLVVPVSVAVGVAIFAVGVRNIFRIDGWMGDTDHLITLWVAELMQAGTEDSMWGHSASYKKGLVFPVLLGLGREGLLLSSMQVVIFVLVLFATFHLFQTVWGKESPLIGGIAFGITLMAWVSSPMFIGFSTYAHGHGIAALAVAVLSRLVIRENYQIQPLERESMDEANPSSWSFVAAIAAAGFVLSQSRIETFVLALLLVMPILERPRNAEAPGELSQRLVIALSGPAGFSVWFIAIGVSPVGQFEPWLLSVALIAVVFCGSVSLYFFPALRGFATVGIPLGISVSLILFLFPVAGSRYNLVPLWQNIFGGDGYWGYSWWFMLLATLYLAYSARKSSRERTLLWMTLIAVLFTVLAKALDISPEFWGIIRLGWSDSVNRSIFHTFPLITAASAIGVARFLLGSRWPKSGKVSDIPQDRQTASKLR